MPGDFEFDDLPAERPRRSIPTRRDREEIEVPRRSRFVNDDVAPKKSTSPILIIGLVGGGLLFLAVAVTIVLVVRKATNETASAANDNPTDPKPALSSRPAGDGIATKNSDLIAGSPTPEIVEKVKRATVRVRVQYNSGRGGSGTGFVEKKSGYVLTNAHVVGLVEPKDRGPRAIELVVNSGEGPGKEFSFGGRLIDFNKEADLALIQPTLIEVGERHVVPDGLIVPKQSVALLQKLFVFGYPFGERLGTEITVSETSVSSLRKDPATGKLAHIQVKGGMNPGNSGGPVVDVRGNVVGVAVAGIQGTDINFAIPGEVVQEFMARKRK